MRVNQAKCFEFIYTDEGPYSNDPGDNGGMTTWGITENEWAEWRGAKHSTEVEMRHLTKAEAAQVYTAWYWLPLYCDPLPSGIDYFQLDSGLLHGIGRAIKWLQIVTNTPQDGVMGPKTMSAIRAMKPGDVIDGLVELRRRRIRTHPDYARFGRGWTNRLTRVTARAKAMIGG